MSWRLCETRPGYTGRCLAREGQWYLQECPAEPGAYLCKLFDAEGNEHATYNGFGNNGLPSSAAMADDLIARKNR
jgi:hypothetical protein